MPGPPPKDPSTRQRRNRSSTATRLFAVPAGQVAVPELPWFPERSWHPQTLDWWTAVWSSPMTPEYDDSDRHGLFMLAVLVDDFWHNPSREQAAEIRLQRQAYGLTPLDRRRLQWEIDRGEAAGQKTAERRATAKPKGVPKRTDPRQALG